MNKNFSDKVKIAIARNIGSLIYQWFFTDLSEGEGFFNFQVNNGKNQIGFSTIVDYGDNVQISYLTIDERNSLSRGSAEALLNDRLVSIPFEELAEYIKQKVQPTQVVGQRAPQCVPMPNSAGC